MVLTMDLELFRALMESRFESMVELRRRRCFESPTDLGIGGE